MPSAAAKTTIVTSSSRPVNGSAPVAVSTATDERSTPSAPKAAASHRAGQSAKAAAILPPATAPDDEPADRDEGGDRREPRVAVGAEAEKDDVPGHVGDEHPAQPEIADGVDEPGHDREGEQPPPSGGDSVQRERPSVLPEVRVDPGGRSRPPRPIDHRHCVF